MPYFATKDLASKLQNSYKQLGMLLVCFIALILLGFYNMNIDPNASNEVPSAFSYAIGAMLISFSVALTISVFERFGISIGFEDAITRRLDDLQENIRDLINMKLDHGLTGVFKKADLELDRFTKLEDGDQVDWINTHIRDYDGITRAIREAVLSKEVCIRILLMPEYCVGSTFRWSILKPDSSLELFLESLHLQEKKIAHFADELTKLDLKGRVEVRFYKYFPGFPLFIFERPETQHEEAYTGFFINKAARQTPYIRWESSAETPYFLDLKHYFEHLWEDESVKPARVFHEGEAPAEA